MAATGPTTMMEGLAKVVNDIGQTMVAPDADVQFLSQLQGVVVGRMRQGMAGGGAQQPQPPGQGPGAGGMSPSPQPQPPTGPPPGAQPQLQGQPTPNGVTPLAPTPDPDELRRMILQKVGA